MCTKTTLSGNDTRSPAREGEWEKDKARATSPCRRRRRAMTSPLPRRPVSDLGTEEEQSRTRCRAFRGSRLKVERPEVLVEATNGLSPLAFFFFVFFLSVFFPRPVERKTKKMREFSSFSKVENIKKPSPLQNYFTKIKTQKNHSAGFSLFCSFLPGASGKEDLVRLCFWFTVPTKVIRRQSEKNDFRTT